MPLRESVSLSASIVCYRSDAARLRETIHTFQVAAHNSLQSGTISRVELLLIDNGGNGVIQNFMQEPPVSRLAASDCIDAGIISGHGNIGYGQGHNLSIRQSKCDYHLVLNPDVIIAENALSEAALFMEDHRDVGLLSPAAANADGSPQYLCKRYPAVIDLALRGFAPERVKRLFRSRLARYEMRDVIRAEPVFDVPIVSGAFMFFRGSVLRQLKGFSDDYFLYFEDFDLSLRTGKVCRIAYVPSVRIVHFGGDAGTKGFRHIRLFVASAFTFYRRHGWKWW